MPIFPSIGTIKRTIKNRYEDILSRYEEIGYALEENYSWVKYLYPILMILYSLIAAFNLFGIIVIMSTNDNVGYGSIGQIFITIACLTFSLLGALGVIFYGIPPRHCKNKSKFFLYWFFWMALAIYVSIPTAIYTFIVYTYDDPNELSFFDDFTIIMYIIGASHIIMISILVVLVILINLSYQLISYLVSLPSHCINRENGNQNNNDNQDSKFDNLNRQFEHKRAELSVKISERTGDPLANPTDEFVVLYMKNGNGALNHLHPPRDLLAPGLPPPNPVILPYIDIFRSGNDRKIVGVVV